MEYKEKALELVKSGLNHTQAAKQVAREYNLKYNDIFRRAISTYIKRETDKGIIDECRNVGIDIDKVKHYWYKGEHYSINVKGSNDAFKYEDFKTHVGKFVRPNHVQTDEHWMNQAVIKNKLKT